MFSGDNSQERVMGAMVNYSYKHIKKKVTSSLLSALCHKTKALEVTPLQLMHKIKLEKYLMCHTLKPT